MNIPNGTSEYPLDPFGNFRYSYQPLGLTGTTVEWCGMWARPPEKQVIPEVSPSGYVF